MNGHPNLTPLQRDTMVIQELTVDGVSPSFEEIAHELELSKPQVHYAVVALRQAGYIGHRRGRARSLEILRPIAMPEDLEFVGFIAGADDAPLSRRGRELLR